MKTVTNIPELKGYTDMPLSAKIEANRFFHRWKKRANHTYISIKRKAERTAFKEFRDLYEPKEFFATFHNDNHRKDDSIRVWFTI